MTPAAEPIEVWNWLAPLWNAGHYLTSLFDWRALAAVGTFAAVFIALQRDSYAEKRRLLLEAAFLSVIKNAAITLVSAIEKQPALFLVLTEDNAEVTLAAKSQAEYIMRNKFPKMALETLNSISLSDLSAPNDIRRLIVCRSAIEHLTDDITDTSKNKKTSESGASLDMISSCAVEWDKSILRNYKSAYPISSRIKRNISF